MRISVFLVFFLSFIQLVFAQWNDWANAAGVRSKLLKAQNEGKIYFSQFHLYNGRGENGNYTSKYQEKTGEILYIYGLDFYYASGTYFDSTYKANNKKNIVDIVKKQWMENRAIPSFSWHLENPYVTSAFNDYMGCRFRMHKQVPDYPAEHQYVVREILEGTGSVCGFGRFSGKDSFLNVFPNPASWFDAMTREVASIINEFVDEDGAPIPMIFRLWHEMEDDWMWWGKSSVTPKEYKRFFILTERKINKYAPKAEILWGYGPDSYLDDENDFMARYPGDEYVDIIGYDDYQLANPQKFKRELRMARMVSNIAQKHNKVAAIFETANREDETADTFFGSVLKPLLNDYKVKFGLVQIWSSGKFNGERQYRDRQNFLKENYVLKIR